MKTKAEIRDKIKALEREKRLVKSSVKPISSQEIVQGFFNAKIGALKWAIGFKTKTRYWCNGCRIMHKEPRCPYCGGETIINPETDL